MVRFRLPILQPHRALKLSRRLRGERGFALIVVIWGLGLISLLALNFAIAINSQTKATGNEIVSARLGAAADSGVILAGIRLASAQQGANPATGPVVLRFTCRTPDGIDLTVTAEDEGGKIDLNMADERLLQRLFVEFGASQDQAVALTDGVVDYRDVDDIPRVHGAEPAEYRAAGIPYGSKNADFSAVEELEQVFGMPPELYAAVRPFLTVTSRRSGIDPQFARPEVSAAAAGLDPASTRAKTEAGPEKWKTIHVPPEFVTPSNRQAFRVASIASAGSSAIFVRDAVLELVESHGSPFAVRSWQRGHSKTAVADSRGRPMPSQSSESLPRC